MAQTNHLNKQLRLKIHRELSYKSTQHYWRKTEWKVQHVLLFNIQHIWSKQGFWISVKFLESLSQFSLLLIGLYQSYPLKRTKSNSVWSFSKPFEKNVIRKYTQCGIIAEILWHWSATIKISSLDPNVLLMLNRNLAIKKTEMMHKLIHKNSKLGWFFVKQVWACQVKNRRSSVLTKLQRSEPTCVTDRSHFHHLWQAGQQPNEK